MMAQKDMGQREWREAVKRNGFQHGPLGLVDPATGTSYGYSLKKKSGNWKVWRRVSLMRAISRRDEDAAKALVEKCK